MNGARAYVSLRVYEYVQFFKSSATLYLHDRACILQHCSRIQTALPSFSVLYQGRGGERRGRHIPAHCNANKLKQRFKRLNRVNRGDSKYSRCRRKARDAPCPSPSSPSFPPLPLQPPRPLPPFLPPLPPSFFLAPPPLPLVPYSLLSLLPAPSLPPSPRPFLPSLPPSPPFLPSLLPRPWGVEGGAARHARNCTAL